MDQRKVYSPFAVVMRRDSERYSVDAVARFLVAYDAECIAREALRVYVRRRGEEFGDYTITEEYIRLRVVYDKCVAETARARREIAVWGQ